jgi:integrase
MSENKVPFTAGRVSKFCCETGRAASFLWDTESTGLGLKASAGGSKVYVLQSRLESGASVRLTIGSTKAWTLGAARDEARRLQVLIDSGIDPRQEKRDRIAAAEAKIEEAKRIAAPAMEAWQAYLAARAPRWSERTLLDHRKLVDAGGQPKTRGRRPGEGDTTQPGMLLSLLSLPLAKIDADRVRTFLKDEALRRPTQTNNAFVRLRAFLNWCADRPEYRNQGACRRLQHAGMARDELPKKAKPRTTACNVSSCRHGSLPCARSAIRSSLPTCKPLLLTGARREEVAGLRWEDVDFQVARP